jgi:putative oxidoreductase
MTPTPAVALIGRLLFALIFILAAPRHFTAEGISHAAELGVPFASFFVPLSGVMALVGGLSVALGFQARLGALLLIAFLVPVTLGMHQFWRAPDAHVQLSMFMKNVSLLGSALVLLHFGAGPLSLDARMAAGPSARVSES